MPSPSVLVIGAGISGLACARALQHAGIDPLVVDRGRAAGGRLGTHTLHGRAVDLGASYFTAEAGTPFHALVQTWVERGIAREWTDTFSTSGPRGIGEQKSGPMRYGAPTGLRDLATELERGLRVEQEREIDRVDADLQVNGIRYDTVVLAMPDPQVRRILAPDAAANAQLQGEHEWEPTIAVALGYEERRWPADLHGAFVNDVPALAFIADDGDRRGDGAPVLVAHSSSELARQHVVYPDSTVTPIVEAVTAVLGIDAAPSWTFAHRWIFARPSRMHDAPFSMVDGIGLCGDVWGTKSSVATAWQSGDALGRAIATQYSV